MQCIVGYIVLRVLSKCWFRTFVRWKHFCPKTRLCETGITWIPWIWTVKTKSNNYWNLWKTNKFAFQHVCNKCLQHLATSSTRHSFASHWLVFHLMHPMSASHCSTIHWPMLKFGGVFSSVESDLPSTSSLCNSLIYAQKFKFTIRCLAQNLFLA